MYVILGIVVFSAIQSQCLSDDILKDAGFTPMKEMTDFSGTVCSNILGNLQSCVDKKNIDSNFNLIKSDGEEANVEAMKKIGRIFVDTVNKKKAFCSAYTNENTKNLLQKDKSFVAQADICDVLKDNESTFLALSAYFEGENTLNSCFNWTETLSTTALCRVISNEADKTIKTGNKKIKVKVTPSMADNGFTSCSTIIFSTCFLNEVTFIDDKINNYSKLDEVKSNRCDNFKKLLQCSGNFSTCPTDLKNELFEKFITPRGNNFATSLSSNRAIAISDLVMDYAVDDKGISVAIPPTKVIV